ncbi:hypothetical protein HDU98_003986 [Podochytrium sp. JEL0797]|nr:hypothetical protein HDU98_003986 [Podochytrium sp. JEL0797]
MATSKRASVPVVATVGGGIRPPSAGVLEAIRAASPAPPSLSSDGGRSTASNQQKELNSAVRKVKSFSSTGYPVSQPPVVNSRATNAAAGATGVAPRSVVAAKPQTGPVAKPLAPVAAAVAPAKPVASSQASRPVSGNANAVAGASAKPQAAKPASTRSATAQPPHQPTTTTHATRPASAPPPATTSPATPHHPPSTTTTTTPHPAPPSSTPQQQHQQRITPFLKISRTIRTSSARQHGGVAIQNEQHFANGTTILARGKVLSVVNMCGGLVDAFETPKFCFARFDSQEEAFVARDRMTSALKFHAEYIPENQMTTSRKHALVGNEDGIRSGSNSHSSDPAPPPTAAVVQPSVKNGGLASSPAAAVVQNGKAGGAAVLSSLAAGPQKSLNQPAARSQPVQQQQPAARSQPVQQQQPAARSQPVQQQQPAPRSQPVQQQQPHRPLMSRGGVLEGGPDDHDTEEPVAPAPQQQRVGGGGRDYYEQKRGGGVSQDVRGQQDGRVQSNGAAGGSHASQQQRVQGYPSRGGYPTRGGGVHQNGRERQGYNSHQQQQGYDNGVSHRHSAPHLTNANSGQDWNANSGAGVGDNVHAREWHPSQGRGENVYAREWTPAPPQNYNGYGGYDGEVYPAVQQGGMVMMPWMVPVEDEWAVPMHVPKNETGGYSRN